MRTKLELLTLVAALAAALNTEAAMYLITNPAGGELAADTSEPGTIGYSFTTGSWSPGYQVDRLGFLDWGQNGLGASHDIGVWTAGGTLVTSANVASGTADPLASGFRWHSVSGLPVLAANTTYVIGALYAYNDPDHLRGVINGPISATVAAGFTLGTGRIIEHTPNMLVFPTATYAGGFGPNMELTPIPETGTLVPVPEPTTVIAGALLLLPFGASALRIVRRNRKA